MYRLFILTVLMLILAPSTDAATRGAKALDSCHLPDYRQEILCGTHEVFEDRERNAGRKITLHFAIVPAVGENPAPDPVVVFAGGPGQSARSLAPLAAAVFSDVIQQRDLVLIDQRGMGASAPLDCDLPEIDLSLNALQRAALARDELARCLDQLDADVTLYTQGIANQDIHDVLQALGYASVNLYGGSWGTRSALLYAHRYPDDVRSIILDGALPLENTAPIYAAEDADRALRMMFEDCRNSPACAAAFPDLEGSFATAVARLEGGITVRVEDPSTGEEEELNLDSGLFGGLLRGILYLPELVRTVPLIIDHASRGQYRPLIGVAGYLNEASGDLMTIGASLTIFCSEELARADRDDRKGDPDTLLGEAFLDDLRNACAVWPKATIPDIYSEDVRSSAPTLILSGDIDPITPPRWGDAIAESLPNARHVVASATGHGVAPVGCAPKLIAQFVEEAATESLDTGCLENIKRPSFFVDTSGPATP